MDFRILGPLEVDHGDRRLALGGTKQRALLGLLLLHANEAVSIDRLVDELWGDAGLREGSKALQVAVSRLRRVLEPDRSAGEERRVLVTRPPGYELRVEPGRLDLQRFQDLVAEARAARAAADLAAASDTLSDALAIWRGPPLSDLAHESFAQTEIARLEELRITTVEQRIDDEVALGHHADLVAELEALVVEHPLRERLRCQLMLALYRSGRQAQALAAYRDARLALVEEFGLEPGVELRKLEQDMLTQDHSLDWTAPRTPREPDSGHGPPPDAWHGRGVLVGREQELGEMVRGLDAAFEGRGALFLLAGEPGIGKSRLAEELILKATARGARVLVGRCWEAGGAPAYWPWVQSLRPYLRDTDAESLRSQLRQGAADVAQLFPESRVFADLPATPALESAGARFRLFDSMTAFLKSVAAARPLVLVLDDLHAADEPSLLLLQFIARELGDSRMLIVGAYRNVDPSLAQSLRTTLTELAREPVTRTLALAGLDEPDVVRFIELAAPGACAADLAPAVHAESEGNPLFVGEIVRLLAAERRLDEPTTAPLAIPQSVREVIGRRLHRLSDECNRLLSLASVLGREFDLEVLASVSGLSRDAIFEFLDEAMEARVVSDAPGVIGRMRFTHALVRDAAYHRLTRSRRVQLHRHVGEALEALYSSQLDPHLAELAHHFIEAAAGGADPKAVDYARRAGSRAVVLLAYEEAVRLYGTALGALGADGPATARLRCEVLLALADAQGRAGDGPEAKSTFLRASELARSTDEPELLARAAVGYGGRFVWDRAISDERLVPLLQDALTALGEGDSALRVLLLSRLGAALRGEPSRARRERICEEAVQAARRIGEPATLAYALTAAEATLHAPANAERRLAEGGEIVSLAGAIGDSERVFDGHEHAFWAAWELGDPRRRSAEVASMTRVAEELRQPAQLWLLIMVQTNLALAEGRFAEAAELIERAAALGERVLSWSAVAARKLQFFLLRREQGRLEGFEREVRGHSQEFPSPLLHQAVLADVYAHIGRTAEAQTVLHALMRRDLSDWHVDEEWLASICLLAETCAILGDTEHAGSLYELLLPYGSLNAVAVPEIPLDSASRPLGILATLLGCFDDGARHFEEALRMNERMGARPGLAHTQEDYAGMLLRRDQRGDRERAQTLLSLALATYDELGMQADPARAALARMG